MSLALFSTIDRAKTEDRGRRTLFARPSALSTVTRVGARSRSPALLLSSARVPRFYHGCKWAHFRYEKGLVFNVIFNVQNFQVGSISLLKWAHFRLKKTDLNQGIHGEYLRGEDI